MTIGCGIHSSFWPRSNHTQRRVAEKRARLGSHAHGDSPNGPQGSRKKTVELINQNQIKSCIEVWGNAVLDAGQGIFKTSRALPA